MRARNHGSGPQGSFAQRQHGCPLGPVGLRLPTPPVAAGTQGPYLAARPEAAEDRVVGAGHCVDSVKAAAGAPQTSAWRKGSLVRGNPHIPRGTAIATFEADGTYTDASGNHAAIYLDQDERGTWVYDQWPGPSVHKRLIRSEDGSGSARGSKSNDGNASR